MQYDYNRSKKRIVRRLVAVCVGVALALLLVFLQRNADGVITAAAEAAMRSYTVSAVNDAVLESMEDGAAYDDLIAVERDGAGDIVAITSNALQINRIARTVTQIAQQKLEEESRAGVDIPLGAFFGIEAWAGLGPSVHLDVIPVAAVSCRFSSDFRQAGINQTRHAVYLDITADISIILPSGTSSVQSVTQVLLCESILVGKVPDVYWQTDIFGDGSVLSAQADRNEMFFVERTYAHIRREENII